MSSPDKVTWFAKLVRELDLPLPRSIRQNRFKILGKRSGKEGKREKER
jgi:hypothetical protein